jgi:predicted enzyme related to lactoylglutathione lyase
VEQIRDLGGRVTVGPVPIPAGRFVVATDPQGAGFALFEGEVDD